MKSNTSDLERLPPDVAAVVKAARSANAIVKVKRYGGKPYVLVTLEVLSDRRPRLCERHKAVWVMIRRTQVFKYDGLGTFVWNEGK